MTHKPQQKSPPSTHKPTARTSGLFYDMTTSKTGPYSPEEAAILTRDYAHTDNLKLAARLGRTAHSLASKARHLGLRKSAAHLLTQEAKRIQPFDPRTIKVAFGRAPKRSQNYDGAELKPRVNRPGAMRAFELPSRWGQQLRYRDGRVEKITDEQ